ncbi:MAG TPA: chemotaxis protein CheW [Chloroflexi bacterium]|nr:chemotaxis protein CheW [Chloroflexota bacterium]
MENRQIVGGALRSSDREDLVAFRLGKQMYALPSLPIIKIIEMVTITPIPQVNQVVEGVINLHGQAVPVINLRLLFGLPRLPFQLRTPIIIVQVKGQRLGLIVDEVIDVLTLSKQQISRVAEIMPEGMKDVPVLRGLAHIQNELVLLLDLDHLLAPGRMQELAQVVSSLPGVITEDSQAEDAEQEEEAGAVEEDGEADDAAAEVEVEEAAEGVES